MEDRVKLSKRFIDSVAVPSTPEKRYADSDVRGLCLRVYRSGEKRFAVKYRVGRQQKLFTIGAVGSPWTVETARDRAREILGELSQGVDPQIQKTASRNELTVNELIDLYLEEGPADKPNKRASSWEGDRSSLHSHIRPLLGKRIAANLVPSDLAKAQADIAAGKTARKSLSGKCRGRIVIRGGKTTAALCVVSFQAMINWAVSRNYMSSHPTKGVVRFKAEKRERFISMAEAQRIFDAIEELERRGQTHPQYGFMVRLLIMTGARRGEIEAMQWREIDFERRCIVLSAARSKTGARRIPLSKAAIATLSTLPRNGAFVFPAQRENAASGYTQALPRLWNLIRKEAGLADLRLHDLRHSFASFAAESGASLQLIGKALGHTQIRTTERYAHLRDDPLQAMVDLIGERFDLGPAKSASVETARPDEQVSFFAHINSG
jgi:integrase